MKHLALSLGGLLLTGSLMAQEVIQWNYNNNASALGSGCSAGDTQFISAGNEISVIFSKLGVQLTGFAGGAKTALKNCRIVIPTKVKAGFYLGKLQQNITYGYNRTEGTDGKVVAVTEFYNQSAGVIEKKIPTPNEDPYDAPWIKANHTNLWRVMPGWCSRSDYAGNYKAQLSVSGYRSDLEKDIIVQIDGQDIRFDALGYPLVCP
jgi:hypothetical protein